MIIFFKHSHLCFWSSTRVLIRLRLPAEWHYCVDDDCPCLLSETIALHKGQRSRIVVVIKSHSQWPDRDQHVFSNTFLVFRSPSFSLLRGLNIPSDNYGYLSDLYLPSFPCIISTVVLSSLFGVLSLPSSSSPSCLRSITYPDQCDGGSRLPSNTRRRRRTCVRDYSYHSRQFREDGCLHSG